MRLTRPKKIFSRGASLEVQSAVIESLLPRTLRYESFAHLRTLAPRNLTPVFSELGVQPNGLFNL